jgi:hypothetical protein
MEAHSQLEQHGLQSEHDGQGVFYPSAARRSAGLRVSLPPPVLRARFTHSLLLPGSAVLCCDICFRLVRAPRRALRRANLTQRAVRCYTFLQGFLADDSRHSCLPLSSTAPGRTSRRSYVPAGPPTPRARSPRAAHAHYLHALHARVRPRVRRVLLRAGARAVARAQRRGGRVPDGRVRARAAARRVPARAVRVPPVRARAVRPFPVLSPPAPRRQGGLPRNLQLGVARASRASNSHEPDAPRRACRAAQRVREPHGELRLSQPGLRQDARLPRPSVRAARRARSRARSLCPPRYKNATREASALIGLHFWLLLAAFWAVRARVYAPGCN